MNQPSNPTFPRRTASGHTAWRRYLTTCLAGLVALSLSGSPVRAQDSSGAEATSSSEAHEDNGVQGPWDEADSVAYKTETVFYRLRKYQRVYGELDMEVTAGAQAYDGSQIIGFHINTYGSTLDEDQDGFVEVIRAKDDDTYYRLLNQEWISAPSANIAPKPNYKQLVTAISDNRLAIYWEVMDQGDSYRLGLRNTDPAVIDLVTRQLGLDLSFGPTKLAYELVVEIDRQSHQVTLVWLQAYDADDPLAYFKEVRLEFSQHNQVSDSAFDLPEGIQDARPYLSEELSSDIWYRESSE